MDWKFNKGEGDRNIGPSKDLWSIGKSDIWAFSLQSTDILYYRSKSSPGHKANFSLAQGWKIWSLRSPIFSKYVLSLTQSALTRMELADQQLPKIPQKIEHLSMFWPNGIWMFNAGALLFWFPRSSIPSRDPGTAVSAYIVEAWNTGSAASDEETVVLLLMEEVCIRTYIKLQLYVLMIAGSYYGFLLNAGHVWRTSRDLFPNLSDFSGTNGDLWCFLFATNWGQ